MVLLLCALLAVAGPAAADVFFEEVVKNPGFGKKKTGARTTTHKVYIKGKRQMVESQIKADKKTARALKKQGQSLSTSTILRLDRAEIYEIDLTARTFVQQAAPPARKPAAKKKAKKGAPKLDFAVKVLGDTVGVGKIPCRRVAAQLRARYFDSKGKKIKRENRYTYKACIATRFPGYREIAAFEALHDSTTAYPSIVGGGLESLEHAEQLGVELAGAKELRGFALSSTLTATVRKAKQKKASEVFRLERRVKAINYQSLPDSLFKVSKSLTRLKGK